MKYVKIIGRPLCALLYAFGVVNAVKNKKPLPLVLLFLTHFAEYFLFAKKVAEEKEISKSKAFINCLAFGFTWWLPTKNEK